MPGVLLVEGMAQTAGAICARKQGEAGNLVYFMTIDNARFASLSFPAIGLSFMSSSRSSVAISGSSTATPRSMASWRQEADIGAMIMRKDAK